MFDEPGDWQRSGRLAIKRKRTKKRKFITVLIRALQRLVLTVGSRGLSLADRMELYDFFDVWDGTQPGQLKDVGYEQKQRDAFPTISAYKEALRDDACVALYSKGWRICELVEEGQHYQAFFTPALHAILDLVRADKDIRLWSGASGPAPPTSLWETPLDADAFRKSERAVMDDDGPGSFVLGIHMFSFQLS